MKTKNGFLFTTLARFLTLIELMAAKTKKSKIVNFLNKTYPNLKVVLYDIGAAGGIESIYRPLINLKDFTAIGFEPDEKEIENLHVS